VFNQDVCECLALFAQCGPGGSQGIKHTEAWSELCTSLVTSLHDTLNRLYGNLDIGMFMFLFCLKGGLSLKNKTN